MDSPFHSLENLFLQLGLSNSPDAIDAFIKEHKLPSDTPLAEAPFWSATQAAFIRESLSEDSDWAEVVDQLNVQLHD
jgi:hypothetical protein